ncbi:patatin-like phospholipase family protein [Prolixibacteraceae bacterium Z1-6]|uniref:Patatin-like phospholipase family protein n=1 Tax=Draconibacterium aestuarii TaxID=2998507 RepID=A0A9X3F657_9BACT|nr:patatin-like phospholipase family protein [Prolixibacteraceae bacterium Z1-6]
MIRFLPALFLAFILVYAYKGYAQETDAAKTKPKIGLVLSGGGAKGMAHIGVIKVLEEAGIKPDIITGTSMGSIIGSLYAVGYTAVELSDINKNANWEYLLTDNVRLRKVAMDEKREIRKYLFVIPIQDNKINLPAGLIEGQQLEAYFSKLLWPLTAHEDFNNLPIPFHCMSVDMVSGNVIEHQSGNLVKAIRASMAIPTVFSPVLIDSMLLVDGGVARNFPVQEAIDMGADIIIGIYVGFQEDVEAADLQSMTDILSRSIALAGIVDARKQLPKCDVLIVPDLGDYGAGDFNKSTIIQQLGEDAARKQFDELEAIAASTQSSFKPVEKLEKAERILVSGFEVEGLQYQSKKFVLSVSGLHKGDSLSIADINEAIEFMYGTQHFRKLTFALKENKDRNGYILVFHVIENSRALFKIAPSYDDDLGVGIVTNFTLRNMVGPATRMLVSMYIAENPGLEISLNKTVGEKQNLSDCFYLRSYGYNLPFYDKGDRLGNYKHGFFEGGYGLRYLLGLNHQIGANGFFKHNRLIPHSDLRSIYPEADFDRFQSGDWGYRLFYKVNTTDDFYFPKKGIKLEVDFAHSMAVRSKMKGVKDVSINYFIIESNAPYATLMIDHNWFKTFARRVTFNFGAGAGFTSEDSGPTVCFCLVVHNWETLVYSSKTWPDSTLAKFTPPMLLV